MNCPRAHWPRPTNSAKIKFARQGENWIILASRNRELLAENSVRHIETLREMEAHKRHYQIRCSHNELELSTSRNIITCSICGKSWVYREDRGFKETKKVFAAEIDD